MTIRSHFTSNNACAVFLPFEPFFNVLLPKRFPSGESDSESDDSCLEELSWEPNSDATVWNVVMITSYCSSVFPAV